MQARLIGRAMVLALVVSFGASSAWAASLARVVAVEGSAQLQESGAGAWIELSDGMDVDSSDVIRTGSEGRVDIGYDGRLENVVRINSDSEVTVGARGVGLSTGSIMAKLDDLSAGESFEAKSPSAICGVRGSGFGLATTGSSSQAFAYENSAYVLGLDANGDPVGDEMNLPEGKKSSIQQGSEPGTPVTMSPSESGAYDQFSADVDALQAGAAADAGSNSPTISPGA